MKYTVLKINHKQYRVREGEELYIDRIPNKEGEKIKFDEVMLLVDEEKSEIGQPVLRAAFVQAEVIAHIRGEKIRTARFRAKSRYRKVKGFRAALTKIRIEKIDTSSAPKTKERVKLI